MTATCLVSQHWPPHIYSHLLSPSRPIPLHICLPLCICRWVCGQSLSCCVFLFPLTTFNHCFVCPQFFSLLSSLCQGSWGGSGVREALFACPSAKVRPRLLLSNGCVLNHHSICSPGKARNSFLHNFPAALQRKRKPPFPCTKWMRMKQLQCGACWSQLHLHDRILRHGRGDIKIGGRGVLKSAFGGQHVMIWAFSGDGLRVELGFEACQSQFSSLSVSVCERDAFKINHSVE